VIEGGTLTSVAGVEVGHWSDEVARTGVTVMTFPEPNVAAVEARGGAPGSRETALLGPGMRVQMIQALVFSGGSAFGLAAADGVVAGLERDGRGHVTPVARVPIVPAAILFDLGVGDGSVRPGPAQGAAAYEARTAAPVAMGAVGAGTGASVGMWGGLDHAGRGGLGSAAVATGNATVAALVVINSVGDAFTLEGTSLTGGTPVPGPPRVPLSGVEQTTLVALATDARLDRAALSRLIVRAHDALAVCLRPAHTPFDGDIVFAVACGERTVSVEVAGEAAFEATGRAVELGIRAVAGLER
jgi:L-aminopeptidase/D-esterase-like protein